MKDLQKAYRYFSKHLKSKSIDEIKIGLEEHGFNGVKVNQAPILDGVWVEYEGEKGFFPRIKSKEIEPQKRLIFVRDKLAKYNFTIPLFIQLDHLVRMLEKNPSQKEVERNFEHTIINFRDLSLLLTERYKKQEITSKYYNQLEESALAYSCSLYRASILTLIPVIEAVIRDIGIKLNMKCSKDVSKGQLLKVLDKLQKYVIRNYIYKGVSFIPKDFMSVSIFDKLDERIQIIENLKFFIKNDFYQHTDSYQKNIMLNRNGIVHGLINDYGNKENYCRLIIVLNILYFCCTLIGTGSQLFPDDRTNESNELELRMSKLFIHNLT